MRRLALIASVLIGASSGAAYAWPFSGNVNGKIIIHTDNDRGHDRYDRDHYDRDNRGYQGRRWDRSRFRAHQTEWMVIGDHLSADANRQFINLNYAPVSQLVIQAERGAPRINQVAIEYAPGDTQVVKLNQQLGRYGNDSQVIDLNGRGRPVNRVIVYTDARFGGSYSVLAR
jgi:hypothetical protein